MCIFNSAFIRVSAVCVVTGGGEFWVETWLVVGGAAKEILTKIG